MNSTQKTVSLLFAAALTMTTTQVYGNYNTGNVEKQIQADKRELESLKIQIALEKTKIKEFDKQIIKSSQKIQAKQKELDTLNTELEKLNNELDVLLEDLEARKDQFKNRILQYYENRGNMGYLDVLMQTTSFGDFLDRVNFINMISNNDNDVIQEYIDNKHDVKQQRYLIDDKARLIEQELEVLKELREKIDRQRQEKDDYMQDLERSHDHLNERILENEEKISVMQAQENALKLDLQRQALIQQGKLFVATGDWQPFIATYYDLGIESTGKLPSHPAYGITASGIKVKEGITIAADPTVIPLGTWVEVKFPDGHVEKLCVQDTGSAIKGNKIDVFKNSAQGYGRDNVQVRIIGFNNLKEDQSIFIRPATGTITSNYGDRDGKLHAGIDIGKNGRKEDVPIVAAASGKVIRSYYSDTYGNVVFIRHNVNGQLFTTLYAHLEANFAKEGQTVNQGDLIGTMGNTGRSFGSHLHFEIHKGDWNIKKSNSINPLLYIKK